MFKQLTITFVLLTILSRFEKISGFANFVSKIPNANLVPNPCSSVSNDLWNALGHYNPGGGGARNQFGIDFAKNQYTWTSTFCRMDSDGDGLTNGEELGDPNCVWSPGQIQPKSSRPITHPGLCTPINSSVCISKNPCAVSKLEAEQYTYHEK